MRKPREKSENYFWLSWVAALPLLRRVWVWSAVIQEWGRVGLAQNGGGGEPYHFKLFSGDFCPSFVEDGRGRRRRKLSKRPFEKW